jgi:aminomuconate-semialdehyde/2-hydroxymuconate-6-semialdehyde dehydrogenase
VTRALVAGVSVETAHWIDGAPFATGDETFEVFSPIDATRLGDVAAGDATVVDAAVGAARRAFEGWAALDPTRRGAILDGFARAILDRKEAFANVETADNGSLLAGNLHRVVDRAAHNIAFFADLARTLGGETIAGPVVDNHVRYEPAGVAALIAPWNAPLLLSTWKVGPALAAGNTVVLKSPEWAPLSCSLLAETASDAGVPPGVFNVVHGMGSVAGQALVDHPGVDRISFTGSTTTGRIVGRAAASNVVPVSLELGGKSPFVVLADADLDEAATTIAAQFLNAGQVCLAGTRILVDESIEGDLRRRVLAASEAYVVGDPRRKGVRVGPLIHPRQLERVDGFVRRAIEAGATVLLGGVDRRLEGLYYPPTILADVAAGAEVTKEEIFGPVLTWQTFRSEAQAIELANATDYGLAAVLFTRDAERATRVSGALVAGTVWVNCYYVRDLGAPFGGARKSGIGREGGRWSFDFFCDVKNVAIKRGSFASRPAHG